MGVRSPEGLGREEKAVARVVLGILKGLLLGELPVGLVTSVAIFCGPAQSKGNRRPNDDGEDILGGSTYASSSTANPAGAEVEVDPFFFEDSLENATGVTQGGRPPAWCRPGFAGEAMARETPLSSRPWARPWGSTSSGGGPGGGGGVGGSRPPSGIPSRPLPPPRVHLPEALPALCRQVATMPEEGPGPRGEVVADLIAAVQDPHNCQVLLTVGAWQQYLLSIIASVQGRVSSSAAARGVDSSL
ncbi:unnamed protein product, partial [Discosporangium mesarthrocarpum]